jgi:ABC-2 type transport system permease protein
MRGFAVFLGKEITEIVRTWRLYVVPGILIFFGLASPLIAHVTPALISNMMGAQGQAITIEVPSATTADAYLQWSKNAMQIALFAIIIASAGAIASERKNGTAQLVLTKPVSRSDMVLAKIVSNWLLVLVATIISAALCAAVTVAVFDAALLAEFAALVAVWYLIACLMVALAVLLSIILKSQAGAAGAGLAVYFVMSIASLWAPARDYSPVGLLGLGDRILTSAEGLSVLWPVLTGLSGIALLIVLACWAFSRQEL